MGYDSEQRIQTTGAECEPHLGETYDLKIADFIHHTISHQFASEYLEVVCSKTELGYLYDTTTSKIPLDCASD